MSKFPSPVITLLHMLLTVADAKTSPIVCAKNNFLDRIAHTTCVDRVGLSH